MIKVVQGDRQTCQSFVEDLKSRVGQASPEIEQTVRDVIEQVRAGGDSAVKAFSEKFDGWTPENLELSREALEQAVAECDPAFIQVPAESGGEHPRLPPAPKAAKPHRPHAQRHHHRPAGAGPAPGGRLRPRGHGWVSLLCADERHPRPGGGGGGDCHGHPAGPHRQADPNILAAAYVAGGGGPGVPDGRGPGSGRPGLGHRKCPQGG